MTWNQVERGQSRVRTKSPMWRHSQCAAASEGHTGNCGVTAESREMLTPLLVLYRNCPLLFSKMISYRTGIILRIGI